MLAEIAPSTHFWPAAGPTLPSHDSPQPGVATPPDSTGLSTPEEHHRAVERVILALNQQLSEPWSLHAMAEVAQFSPCYFNRIFRRITNIPPGKFLAALRMATAKRLLLSTDLSVTDACFEVGYQSLGSFTRDFTQSVGLSPRSLRRLGKDSPIPEIAHLPPARKPAGLAPAGLAGHIQAPETPAKWLFFVALFATPIPQGAPVSCDLLTAPGAFRLAPVPDGRFYLVAAAFPRAEDPTLYLLPNPANVWIGSAPGPILVHNNGCVKGSATTDITLRQARLTDPPILIALPFLLARHQPALAVSGDSARAVVH